MTGDLFIAVAIGIAFGIALESAGLGNARKLSGLFYLRDLTVLKVMLSAILTAALGVFWLDVAGVLDEASIHVPETWIWPQLAGGVLFGIGFALSGLCPGTACVSAASGRMDGLAVIGGITAGILLTGFFVPAIEPFFNSGAQGVLTLPEVTGLAHGHVLLAVTLIGVAIFRGISAWEQRA